MVNRRRHSRRTNRANRRTACFQQFTLSDRTNHAWLPFCWRPRPAVGLFTGWHAYGLTLVYVIPRDRFVLDRLYLGLLVLLLQEINAIGRAQSTLAEHDQCTDIRGSDVYIYAGLSKLEEIGDEFGLEVCAEDRISFLGDIAIQALSRVS